MNSAEILQTFVDFMTKRGHALIPSASVVPYGDPTLLFTNAGMVPFKPYFMGLAEPPSPRMVSVQKVIRTKDIDDVGDYSHLTFFEMLGNFSIGDYFKKEAIEWAWALLTEGFGLDGDKLWVSIFLDDEEAHDHWRHIGISEDRIHRYDHYHNYWPPGDWDGIGPCGPNSEIFVDRGPRADCEFCQKGECKPNLEPDCGRFLEIWNLVFMTLYQADDGTRTDLPRKNIDTGSGLERVTCVLQGKDTVYDTDVFAEIIDRIESVSGKSYGESQAIDVAVRIVADHARAAAIMITDGVLPSNEGRGYVLRRILRRAVYHLTQLSGPKEDTLLDKVAAAIIDKMEYAHPDLRTRAEFTLRLLAREETKFRETLDRGRAVLEDTLTRSDAADKIVRGDDVFALYDTYGYPPELTQEIAAQRGFAVDMRGFEQRMDEQRERGRAAGKFEFEAERVAAYTELAHIKTTFVGYNTTSCDTTIAAIIGPAGVQDSAIEGDAVEIVLPETPFYAEGGGQAGDEGTITGPGGRVVIEDTQNADGLIVHRGHVAEGRIAVNEAARGEVDESKRRASQRNHTATHLLHAALREVLGTHVRQAGSLVAPDRLRFDFTHIEATKPEELAAAQRLVNEKIRADIPVHWEIQPYDEAVESGALALFDEKYAANVRVVGICEPTREPRTHTDDEDKAMHCFSKELCGGTHCGRTGEIGSFVIASETSVGSGLRRIEALSGPLADEYVIGLQTSTNAIARRLNTTPDQLEVRVAALESELDAARRKAQQFERQAGRAEVDTLLDQAERIDGASVVVARVPAGSVEAMREMGDLLKDKLGSAVVVLGAVLGERPNFLAMVTKDLAGRVHAGNLVKEIASVTGGGGGGRPDMAQAGGKDAARLDEALGRAKELAREGLAGKR